MSFCQKHWDDLKEGVKFHGMWELVAPSGQAVIARIKQELDETASNSTYDPLMSAHWMMMNAALHFGGLEIINQCPLCLADENGGHSQEWIDECLDEIRKYVDENHLLDF